MKNEERREKNESAREREVGGEEDWEVWRPLIFFSVAAFLHSPYHHSDYDDCRR